MALSVKSEARHDRPALVNMFQGIQQTFINELENLEKKHLPAGQSAPHFNKKSWVRGEDINSGGNSSDDGHDDGGTMALMHGHVFEKVGVNFSSVQGQFSPEFANRILGTDVKNLTFWASGVSFVGHPRNPFAPIGHMNVRAIETTEAWFGGGGDLTPTFPFDEDTQLFHQTLERACPNSLYPAWKKECDNYFYLPHRKEPRGVGGIFFDHLNIQNGWNDPMFLQNVALSFLKAYTTIVDKRHPTPYTGDHRKQQLIKRGRYVEFNLIHDRGTLFGLQTGGNTEAILMSLPPVAAWP